MTYSVQSHYRRSIRLLTYDYTSSGAYFVTVCTFRRECLFEDAQFRSIVENVWLSVADGSGPLDEFVVMPNHVHGIVWIQDQDVVGAQQPCRHLMRCPSGAVPVPDSNLAVAAPLQRFAVAPGSLGAVVRAFKAASSKRINNLRRTPGMPVWQRGYYEHVVRGGGDLGRIRQYILDNPRNWEADPDNPGNVR